MSSNETKEVASLTEKLSRPSDRFESLLEFLDKHENGLAAEDLCGSTSNRSLGLVDVTNGQSAAERVTEDKKKLQNEKMTAARATILDMKAASYEIQARAAKLRAEQEKLKTEVEHLHTVRIENEANHVKSMRRLKKELKERLTEIESKHEEVSQCQLINGHCEC